MDLDSLADFEVIFHTEMRNGYLLTNSTILTDTDLGTDKVNTYLEICCACSSNSVPQLLIFRLPAEVLTLTPWLMEPGGSMPHSQGLSNNSYHEPNQPNYPH